MCIQGARPLEDIPVPFSSILWAPASRPQSDTAVDEKEVSSSNSKQKDVPPAPSDGQKVPASSSSSSSSAATAAAATAAAKDGRRLPPVYDRIFAADPGGRVAEWRFEASGVINNHDGNRGLDDVSNKRTGDDVIIESRGRHQMPRRMILGGAGGSLQSLIRSGLPAYHFNSGDGDSISKSSEKDMILPFIKGLDKPIRTCIHV